MSNDNTDLRWRRSAPLKSRWYDDHFGHDASAHEVIANRARAPDELLGTSTDEDVRSREVERFFDLFDAIDSREPRS